MWFASVAPLAGAWIEIGTRFDNVREELVAPLAGAWIEIAGYAEKMKEVARRSPRGSVD